MPFAEFMPFRSSGGFDADEDRLFTLFGPFFSASSAKNTICRSGARGGGQSLCDDVGLFQRFLVEYRVQQFVQLGRFHAQNGGRSVDQTLF